MPDPLAVGLAAVGVFIVLMFIVIALSFDEDFGRFGDSDE